MKTERGYVSLSPILRKNAHYNMLIGVRSNGKSTAVLEHVLEQWYERGYQTVYIRRTDEDLKSKRIGTLFDSITERGVVSKLTKGKRNEIYHISNKWYLQYRGIDENGKEYVDRDDIPFMVGFSLTSMSHNKSTSFPLVRIIFFDEFLTDCGYLNDEVMVYMNTLSTFIRNRDDVRIFMCGNTINPYAPYFKEFGIKNVSKMKGGDINVYTYEPSPLRVALYMTDALPSKLRKSSVYFAFDNPRLSSITGEGNYWDMRIYPHCPCEYQPKDVYARFFIDFDEQLFQGNVIVKDNEEFIYIHCKTSPIKNPQEDLVYSLEYSPNSNYRKFLNRPLTQLEKNIALLFQQHKVFYQDNDVGNAIHNYLCEIDKLRI